MGSKGWFAIAITVPLCHAELVLRGRVVDENDAPVASALVSVHPAAAASPTLEARTDPAGADRYPANFDLNLAIERMVMLHGYRFALRGGVNNLTNQMNPTAVNNVVGAPQFLQFLGGEGRHFMMRIRFFGRAGGK